jgi:NAD(P)-dependent dehydrogenase (short-subunit alcohol dehydrogenase family)
MSAMAGMDQVLVVGGTGHLGGQVVRRLREQGRAVRALVRPGSDAAGLEAQGVEIARGDMMDPASLDAAMAGMGVVITSAAGYTARRKGDTLATDDLGNRHLVAAAKRAGVRRFVFTSVLTCDQTPDVPHLSIDLGCDVPVSTNDVAALASRLLGREVRVREVPWPLINAGTAVVGLFSTMVRDMRPAFRHFLTGRYVADTTLQARHFGGVPTAEASLRRYMERAGLLAAA